MVAVEPGREQFESLTRGYTVFEKSLWGGGTTPYFDNLCVISSTSGQLFSYSDL